MVEFDFDPDRDIGSLSGKVIFVTGGTGGLGLQTVVSLAKHSPARIYFSGRNEASAEALIKRVRDSGFDTPLSFVRCDLASLASVKAAADSFLSGAAAAATGSDGSDAVPHPTRLDLFVANAGISGDKVGVTEDGYELTLGTNHVGHALLIRKLLPLMERTAAEDSKADVRIVVLTSMAYEFSLGMDWGYVRTPRAIPVMGTWLRYGRSKLANLLYARALAKRYPGILTVSCHPGIVTTEFVQNLSALDRFIVSAGAIVRRWPTLSPEQGVYNQLFLATASRDKFKSGEVYEPVGVHSPFSTAAAKDGALADKLWDWTEEELKQWM